jgi:hypothetical protein
MFGKYSKWSKNTNIFLSKTLQSIPKVGFFGMKINHLATLIRAGD